MKKFVIDVNLPYYFSLWNTEVFIHMRDINDEWSDEQIWNYAKDNNLTIITKDSDFSNKIIFHSPPPKVIHVRFGNVKMKEFFSIIAKHWQTVLTLNQDYKLVNIFKDKVEGIS